MKVSFVVVLYLAHAVIASVPYKNWCSADDCAQAVTGRGRGSYQSAAARSDCGSFLLQTVAHVSSYVLFLSDHVSLIMSFLEGYTICFAGDIIARCFPQLNWSLLQYYYGHIVIYSDCHGASPWQEQTRCRNQAHLCSCS